MDDKRNKLNNAMLPQCKKSWFIWQCWCCLDRRPGSFDVEDATTLSWSSAAV